MVLAQALQPCTIQSRMPQGLLCRAVQELHRCLTPLLEKGDLLNNTMLDVVEKDTVTPPVPAERVSSLEKKSEPREEELTNLPDPNEQQDSEPEGAAHSGELALVQRRLPLASWIYWFMGALVWPTPLEDVDLSVNIPLGSSLDLSSLGSLQVIVSHNHMTEEVWYQYQSRVVSQMSLQLAPSEPLDQPDSPP